jgi:hypothetical protein
MGKYLEIRKKVGDGAPHDRFGDHWAYGFGQKEEPSWCRSVYDADQRDQPQGIAMDDVGERR